MAPNYDARMDPMLYNEWMKLNDPEFVPSEGDSSSSESVARDHEE